MIVRALLSRAASCTNDRGGHERMMRVWDVRKAFFDADLDELVHVHFGHDLRQFGHCWLVHKALYGTWMASHMR